MSSAVIDALGIPVSSFEDQLVATGVLAVVVVVIGVGLAIVRNREWKRVRVVNVLLALIGLGIVGVAGWELVVIWELTPVVLSVFEAIQIDNPAVTIVQFGITIAVIFGTYLLTGVVKRIIHEVLSDQGSITRHQTELTFRTTQVGLLVSAGIVILGVWNVDLSGILVGAGFLGIVLGLAARQTLGSLIAGFVLMFARPFEIGDWVAIGDRQGIVTEISIVNTRIQTFDGEYAMIPNDTVGSQEIINRTRKGRLRIHVEVGVDYATDLEEAVEIATEAMTEVEGVLAVPQPQVVLTEFGESAIVLDLRYWIDKPSIRRKNQSQTAVIQAVKRDFDEAGIKIPFPQRELMSRLEEGGFNVATDAWDVDDGE